MRDIMQGERRRRTADSAFSHRGRSGVPVYELIILDDDKLQAEATASAIAGYPGAAELFSVKIIESLADLDRYVQTGGAIDVLFADIVLNGEASGIDAVRRLAEKRSGMQVIYATGYIEYCTRVYQTDHVYFLRKPLVQDEVSDAIDRALANLEELRARRPLILKSYGHVISVPIDSIEYIESDRRKVRVHADDKTVEAYGALADVARILPSSFVRCHKSFIVNMDRILEFDGGEVGLRSGVRIPVSQRHRRAVRETFVAYLSQKA